MTRTLTTHAILALNAALCIALAVAPWVG